MTIDKNIAILALSGLLGACQPQSSAQSTDTNINASTNINAQHNAQNSIKTNQPSESVTSIPNAKSSRLSCDNAVIYRAYQQHNAQQKTQVLGCGNIIKVLKDDTDGSRHQRFLVKLDGYPNITILIAHNIDLAARIPAVQAQTPIQFYGEYIYNPQGGVVHWTHKDPAARHQDGWLYYHYQRYS